MLIFDIFPSFASIRFILVAHSYQPSTSIWTQSTQYDILCNTKLNLDHFLNLQRIVSSDFSPKTMSIIQDIFAISMAILSEVISNGFIVIYQVGTFIIFSLFVIVGISINGSVFAIL
jgi:hypothetical protein